MSLDEVLVAVSVSEPGDGELAARGLTEDHLRHAFVELARQLLAAGASLGYGGDLRAGGYTRTLLSLLRTYSIPDRPGRQRIRQYLAASVWSQMSDADRGRLAVHLTRVDVPPAARPGDTDDEPQAVRRARDLTAMRVAMTQDATARVLLGGRLSGQAGRWPGVVEEAYLARRARRPLYVAGGFGGAAARVAAATRGSWPTELSPDYQLAHAADADDYRQLLDADLEPTERQLRDVLGGDPDERPHGELAAGPWNGLDADENELLERTADLDQLTALVLRGCTSRF